MQKLKSLNFGITGIIKSVLIGIVSTLVGIVIFAIVLKFANIPSNAVNYVNDVIKALSIFIMVLILKRKNTGGLLIKSVVAGLLYAVLSFIIFSILNGGMVFDMSVLFDLLFAVAVSVIVSIILNLFGKRA